jgi:hypothetical protein
MTIVKKLLIVASMALGLQAINVSANTCQLTPGSPCQSNRNNNKALRACPCSKNTRIQKRQVKRTRVQRNVCPCMKRSK